MDITFFAGNNFVYTANVALDNTVTWTANTRLTNLDYQPLFVSNVEVGIPVSTLTPIVTNTPSSNNFTLTVSASSNTTILWFNNSVVNTERPLYMFTTFTSNTGTTILANTVLLRVKSAIANGQSQSNSNPIVIPSFAVGSNVTINSTTIFIGNSTVNTSISADSVLLNGLPISGGSGTPGGTNTDIQFNDSGSFNGTSGLTWDKTANIISIGNSTVNATVNSTIYSQTANNTLFVSVTSAANVVSNAQLIANLANYQTLAGEAANVITLTSNNTLFVGSTSAVNVVSNAQLQSNLTNYYLATNPSGYISAIGPAYVQNTDSRVLSGNLQFSGANVTLGNSTVFATVNSTIYSQTANNALNLNGIAASLYQLNSTLAANVATMTANNSTNFAGQPQSFYANVTSPVITTSLEVGAAGNNVTTNTTAILLGNSTVFATVNSTIYSQTANNALNLGGTAAASFQLNSTLAANVATLTSNNSTYFGGQLPAFYANVTNPIFTTTTEVGGVTNNVTTNTTAILLGNSTVFSTVNSTIFSQTANNATNFNGQLASFYYAASNPSGYISAVPATYVQNTDSRTLSGNLTLAGTNTVISSNLTVSGSTLEVGAVGNNVTINTTAILLGNSTVFSTVNSTIYSQTANNTLFVGATSAANVVSNTQLMSNLANYQTTAGLSANVATLTSNNSLYLGGIIAASYVQNTDSRTLSGNLTIAGTNTVISSNLTVSGATISMGANVVVNTSVILVGNSTVYTSGNSSTEIVVGPSSNTTINNSIISITDGVTNTYMSVGYISTIGLQYAIGMGYTLN